MARAGADALLSFLSALLGLLPGAIALVRRGGVAADAAHTYVLLLRRLASEGRWGRHALENQTADGLGASLLLAAVVEADLHA